MITLKERIKGAATEEELKHDFANFFKLRMDTRKDIDLYTPEILFEFKLDKNLNNPQIRAACFAQTLYYVRNLKYGYRHETRPPTNSICVVTKNLAALLPTEDFFNYYDKSKDRIYDWDLPPSNPCKKLVADLADDKILRECHVFDFVDPDDLKNFVAQIKQLIKRKAAEGDVKKEIDEHNFYDIFDSWRANFAKAVNDERKASEYFITDIESGKSEMDENHIVTFQMSAGEIVTKLFPAAEYTYFWNHHEKVDDAEIIRAIRQKMDRMTEINSRRRTGEFFTPIEFAAKGLDYLSRTLGDWWKDKNFRLWDMAAGTGNLEFYLPEEALPKCYLSTLLQDDADYCQSIYPNANVFQYDYLNDDVEFLADPKLEAGGAKRKMPPNLVADLKNPKIKWIIFINPPYATANNYERDKTKINKDKVADTKIRKLMTLDDLGSVSQELASQFLYRISKEFQSRKVWLGMFSKIKYINSNVDQKMRDKFFRYKYERGFVFSSKNFQGCKANFPVGFLIWNLAENIPLENQAIALDVFNEKIEKVAVKNVQAFKREECLNKWIERPPCTIKFPPMKSALNFCYDAKNLDDLVSEEFLAAMMFKGNDFLNQNGVALLSGPYSSGHDISVTPKIFEQCMVVHMVRRLPKATWLNDRDQFMQPNRPLPPEFIADAVIWSLFAPSNQTASLRNVEYEGKIYQLKNNLYPFLLAEVKTWACNNEAIKRKIAAAQDDRFAALWLQEHRAEISAEGQAVLEEGRQVYKTFYRRLNILDCAPLKIEDWDAGWYQVRMSWKLPPAFNAALEKLSEKLLPQIYELGFLRDEVTYF